MCEISVNHMKYYTIFLDCEKFGNLNIFFLFIIYLFLYLYKVVCSDEMICSVTFVTIKIANINTLKNVP